MYIHEESSKFWSVLFQLGLVGKEGNLDVPYAPDKQARIRISRHASQLTVIGSLVGVLGVYLHEYSDARCVVYFRLASRTGL